MTDPSLIHTTTHTISTSFGDGAWIVFFRDVQTVVVAVFSSEVEAYRYAQANGPNYYLVKFVRYGEDVRE